MNDYQLVDSDQALPEVLDDLDTFDSLGVDAERASGFKYGQDAYLVQLIGSKTAYLIDPKGLSAEAIGELAAVVNKKEWILHSATQDLPCLRELGLIPKKIFDTEVAAKLLGFERFGLAAIVSELEQFELAKEHSAADWSIRPLSSEMLEYAAQDVYFLKSITSELSNRLKEIGRMEFAEEEFRHLLNFRPKPIGDNPWRKTSGIHLLKKPIQLARLREMWLVRDAFAFEQDIAPGRVVSDKALSYAAGVEYKNLAEMKRDKQFHGRLLPKLYTRIFDAYKAAENSELPPLKEQSSDQTPHHKNWQKLKPDVDKRYKEFKTLLAELVDETGIPAEAIMSPGIIRDAFWNEVPVEKMQAYLKNSGARDWQLSLVLPLILNLS